MGELLLHLTQFTVAVVSLIGCLFYALSGDYTRATYHLGWAILMSIFLATRALKEDA